MADQSIGALWLKDGQRGKFYSGKVKVNGTEIGIVIFKNDHKQPGEKTPDYRIFAQRSETGSAKPPTGGQVDEDGDVPF